MTDQQPATDPAVRASLARIENMLSELNATLRGGTPYSPARHLYVADAEAREPQARLADVIDFPRRAGQERSGT
jgi:hypothetical protein